MKTILISISLMLFIGCSYYNKILPQSNTTFQIGKINSEMTIEDVIDVLGDPVLS